MRTSAGKDADGRASADPGAAPSIRPASGWPGRRAGARCCRRTPPRCRRGPGPAAPSIHRTRAPAGPCAPTGTTRVLLPLPSTRTVRSAAIQVREVQADEFREAQARGIQQLHDRPVAHREQVRTGNLQQSAHGVRIQGDRQSALALRRAHVHGAVALEHALADQEVEEAAHRRQPALHAARREAAGVRAGGEQPDVDMLERRPVG